MINHSKRTVCSPIFDRYPQLFPRYIRAKPICQRIFSVLRGDRQWTRTWRVTYYSLNSWPAFTKKNWSLSLNMRPLQELIWLPTSHKVLRCLPQSQYSKLQIFRKQKSSVLHVKKANEPYMDLSYEIPNSTVESLFFSSELHHPYNYHCEHRAMCKPQRNL